MLRLIATLFRESYNLNNSLLFIASHEWASQWRQRQKLFRSVFATHASQPVEQSIMKCSISFPLFQGTGLKSNQTHSLKYVKWLFKNYIHNLSNQLKKIIWLGLDKKYSNLKSACTAITSVKSIHKIHTPFKTLTHC